MQYNILIVRETKSGEARVSLIPKDVAKLMKAGHKVFVENEAGVKSGFSNNDYQAVGAAIRHSGANLENLFQDIDVVVRAKRPEKVREKIENTLFHNGMILIGALDPFEPNSTHIDEYKKAGIIAYSIDQLDVPIEDPMNILANMSKLAGKLALKDALQKTTINTPQKCLIIGTGVAGMAAIEEALEQNLKVQAIVTNPDKVKLLEQMGITAYLMSRDLSLVEQQDFVADKISDADIVITTARRNKQKAPILIPKKTLERMQSGACIVDLALSEGGNVKGSEHDETLRLGNNVIVTNVSGYPKSLPKLASEKWSRASLRFIELMAQNDTNIIESAKLTK